MGKKCNVTHIGVDANAQNKKLGSPRIYSVKSAKLIWTDAGGTGKCNRALTNIQNPQKNKVLYKYNTIPNVVTVTLNAYIADR